MMIDYLYQDEITIFNRCEEDGSIIWIPHKLKNVHCWGSSGTRTGTQGDSAMDNYTVNIRYIGSPESPEIDSLIYLQPKKFKRLDSTEAEKYITFASGDMFDFFIKGNLEEFDGKISDDDYFHSGGFFNYMNHKYDDVYAITSCSQSRFLPHFTVSGR